MDIIVARYTTAVAYITDVNIDAISRAKNVGLIDLDLGL